MSNARNLANLLESDGDIKVAALDNAPAPTKSTIDALGIAATSLTGSQATAITAALPKSGGTMTGDLTVTNVTATGVLSDSSGNVRSGRKNFILNGGFDVWQRGTTGAQANSGFVADRWKGNNYTTGTLTFSQRTDATGQTFRTYGRLAQSSAGSNNSTQGIMQWIEGLHLVGKTITVSFKVRGNAALSGCKVRGVIAEQTFNLTTDWVKHSFTGTGIQDGSNTRLMFDWGLENTTWHVDIAEVQVEVGSGTDFEHRSYGEELHLCQRYYEIIADGGRANDSPFFGVGQGVKSDQINWFYDFKAEKRAAFTLIVPTVTNGYQAKTHSTTKSGNSLGFTSVHQSLHSIMGYMTQISGVTEQSCWQMQLNGAAAHIAVSAEL